MIPGEIFTRFSEFQGFVSVNDFRLPISLQELLQASLGFLWSFGFARIRLDPLGGQVLQHDCISVIVSRFVIVTEDLMICCYQVTKIFRTKCGSTIASSTRGPSNFSPLAELAICVLKELSINTVLTQILTSLVWSWEEQAWESPCSGISSSTKFFNSRSHSGISELGRPESANNGSLRSLLDSFLIGFGFLLTWSISGCPDRSSTVVDTITGEMSLSVRSSRSRVWISLTVGDEDVLEEDVE